MDDGFEPMDIPVISPDDDPDPEPQGVSKGFAAGIAILCAVVALIVGGLIGYFGLLDAIIPGSAGGLVTGKVSLTEEELDLPVGTWTMDGTTHEITARRVLEDSVGLANAQNDDGTYKMPSADSVLSSARNAILNQAVEEAGITVSDEDAKSYALETMGTDDYSQLAEQYGLAEDQVAAMVKDSAGVQKLYEQVTASAPSATMPEAPTAAAEGQEDAPTAEYGAYIVGLIGDDWDSANDTWANTNNPYYEALKDESFSSEGASYNQAEQAYFVAYQQYSEQAGTASSAWQDYVNGLLSKASMSLGELVA